MKVYIGPYRSDFLRISIHYGYMNWKYGRDWQDSTTKFEMFLEKTEDKLQWLANKTINKLLKRRKRKISVRIDPTDTWSMDTTLAYVILPMLKQIASTKHGAPDIADEDVPDELKSTVAEPKENEWDIDSNHFKRWDWVLGEMIYAFECEVDPNWDEQYHTGKHDLIAETEIDEDGKKIFAMRRGPNHTHVFDMETYKKDWARRANGTRLFGKYYNSLWD